MPATQQASAGDITASILSRLREETATQHRALEEGIGLLSPSLDLEQYARILGFFQVAFDPWEKSIEENCPAGYAGLWQGRRKVFRIAEDLRTLGLSPILPRAAESLPQLSHEGMWLGSLYVMEGSTLGGQFISRHLERHFGWSLGRGYSFFRGYGILTSERWRAVCSALRDSSAAANQILSGAHQSYDYLARCLPYLHDIAQFALRSKSDKL